MCVGVSIGMELCQLVKCTSHRHKRTQDKNEVALQRCGCMLSPHKDL